MYRFGLFNLRFWRVLLFFGGCWVFSIMFCTFQQIYSKSTGYTLVSLSSRCHEKRRFTWCIYCSPKTRKRGQETSITFFVFIIKFLLKLAIISFYIYWLQPESRLIWKVFISVTCIYWICYTCMLYTQKHIFCE